MPPPQLKHTPGPPLIPITHMHIIHIPMQRLMKPKLGWDLLCTPEWPGTLHLG